MANLSLLQNLPTTQHIPRTILDHPQSSSGSLRRRDHPKRLEQPRVLPFVPLVLRVASHRQHRPAPIAYPLAKPEQRDPDAQIAPHETHVKYILVSDRCDQFRQPISPRGQTSHDNPPLETLHDPVDHWPLGRRKGSSVYYPERRHAPPKMHWLHQGRG